MTLSMISNTGNGEEIHASKDGAAAWRLFAVQSLALDPQRMGVQVGLSTRMTTLMTTRNTTGCRFSITWPCIYAEGPGRCRKHTAFDMAPRPIYQQLPNTTIQHRTHPEEPRRASYNRNRRSDCTRLRHPTQSSAMPSAQTTANPAADPCTPSALAPATGTTVAVAVAVEAAFTRPSVYATSPRGDTQATREGKNTS